MDLGLAQRVYVVTGGSAGLGRAAIGMSSVADAG